MFTVSLFFPVRIRRNDPKRREELDKGAMAGVNERLNKRDYFVPCQSGEKDIFCFVYSFPLTLVDCEAGLLFYILIYYITPYFLLLYIY